MFLRKRNNEMKIYRYEELLEKLKPDSIDPKTLKVLKQNLVIRLKECKEYILSNIFIEKNVVYFSSFNRLNIRVMLRQLNNEFSEEFIETYKVKELLEYIDSLMVEPKTNIKSKIRDKFYSYFNLLS
jgi:hypothetical protein